MKLQRHERTILDAARKMVPDLQVELTPQGNTHKRITLIGPNGRRSTAIACSPKNQHVTIASTKRWIRKTAPTVR